jgi:hypothetical protein
LRLVHCRHLDLVPREKAFGPGRALPLEPATPATAALAKPYGYDERLERAYRGPLDARLPG